MSLCSGIRADGGHCRAQAMRNSEWCINHDPDQAEARHRRASRGGKRGGRGRPASGMGEIEAIKADVLADIEAVRDGTLHPRRAAVVFQGHNARLRAVAEWRKTREQEEIIPRIELLEQRERASQGSWR